MANQKSASAAGSTLKRPASGSKQNKGKQVPLSKPGAKAEEKVPRLTDLEKAFCMLAETKGLNEAASRLGLDQNQLRALQKSGAVRRYQEAYRKDFLREMARAEVKRIIKLNVTREDIISGLYSLAMTPAELTKGNINGQVAAYDSLSELLGLKLTPRDADNFFKDKTPEELQNFALHGSFTAPATEKA
jgi:hypothetical protein